MVPVTWHSAGLFWGATQKKGGNRNGLIGHLSSPGGGGGVFFASDFSLIRVGERLGRGSGGNIT